MTAFTDTAGRQRLPFQPLGFDITTEMPQERKRDVVKWAVNSAHTFGDYDHIHPERVVLIDVPATYPAREPTRTFSNLFGLISGKKTSGPRALAALRIIDHLILVDIFDEMLRSRADTPASTQATPIAEPSRLEEAFTELKVVLNLATEVHIEDGIDNEFYLGFRELLTKYGNVGLTLISDQTFGLHMPEHTLSTLLGYVGKLDDNVSTAMRRQLLEGYLTHESAVVRDGALVGLSYVESPDALPSLRAAYEREPYGELKQDILNVIEELETN